MVLQYRVFNHLYASYKIMFSILFYEISSVIIKYRSSTGFLPQFNSSTSNSPLCQCYHIVLETGDISKEEFQSLDSRN